MPVAIYARAGPVVSDDGIDVARLPGSIFTMHLAMRYPPESI